VRGENVLRAKPKRKVKRAAPRKGKPGYRLIRPDGKRVPLPEDIARVVEEAANALAAGNPVSLVSTEELLTTEDAAVILGVSRQYVVRLCDEGQLPAGRAGSHRRLRLADLLAFREARRQRELEGLREIVRITEEAGGYPELAAARKRRLKAAS
jgi:excisionase family DNA binding protein